METPTYTVEFILYSDAGDELARGYKVYTTVTEAARFAATWRASSANNRYTASVMNREGKELKV